MTPLVDLRLAFGIVKSCWVLNCSLKASGECDASVEHDC